MADTQILTPFAIARIGSIPTYDGYPEQQGICWPTVALDWADENQTNINGRMHKNKGEVQPAPVVKGQDTFQTGTAGRTGRDFSIVSGTWKSDVRVPQYDKYGLFQLDQTAGVAFEVVSTSTTPKIEHAYIFVHRGLPPAGSSSAHTTAGTFAYLHLAYQGTAPAHDCPSDYRVAMVYGQPIRLEASYDGGASWIMVDIERNLGNLENVLKAHNGQVRIGVYPDYERSLMDIEIWNGNYLRHSPGGTRVGLSGTLLPAPGNIRLVGQNGMAGLEYYPLRYPSLTVNKQAKDYQFPLRTASAVTAKANALTPAIDNQTTTLTPNAADGQNVRWDVTASRVDAGDGLGSAEPARLTDVTVFIPSQWTDHVPGGIADFATVSLPVMRVEERQFFNDAERTFGADATVWVQNVGGVYSAGYGNLAVELTASNNAGGAFYPRMRGMAGAGEEGWVFIRQDPMNVLKLPCVDNRKKLMKGVGQEIIFDGWCLYAAVRWLCNERGAIHEKFLYSIPEWEYGPVRDTECPYYVLPKGTGLNAKYKYSLDTPIWKILTDFVQDSTTLPDPMTARINPFVMGFAVDGQFFFRPFDPLSLQPVIHYSDYDPTGIAQIAAPGLQVSVSAAQMRSELIFQGIDAESYELIQYRHDQPPSVKQRIGYPYEWVERSARYADLDLMASITETAAVPASLPVDTVHLRTVFQPWVNCGDMCLVTDSLNIQGTAAYIIMDMQHEYGIADLTGHGGIVDCYSNVTARALVNFL